MLKALLKSYILKTVKRVFKTCCRPLKYGPGGIQPYFSQKFQERYFNVIDGSSISTCHGFIGLFAAFHNLSLSKLKSMPTFFCTFFTIAYFLMFLEFLKKVLGEVELLHLHYSIK